MFTKLVKDEAGDSSPDSMARQLTTRHNESTNATLDSSFLPSHLPCDKWCTDFWKDLHPLAG